MDHLGICKIWNSGFLEFLKYEYNLKSSMVCKMKCNHINYQTTVKICEFFKPPTIEFSNLYQPSVNLSTWSSLPKLNFWTILSCSFEKSYNTKVVGNLMKSLP